MFPHFQKYLNPQVRTKKLVNSVFYHPCPSRLASRIHPFIFLLTLLTHIPRKSLNLCFFTHAPVPHSKLLVEFFENLFPPRQKGLEEAMICSVKIQSENMKMTWNISLFPFGMIAIFLNVMALQFWK